MLVNIVSMPRQVLRYACVIAVPPMNSNWLQDELRGEVLDMSKRLAASGMQLLVIDTENKFVSTGFAKEIAVCRSSCL